MNTLPPSAQEGNIPQYKVYRLINKNHLPFYVGITINLLARYKQHMRCDGTNEQKDAIIQEDLQADFITIMETIERVDTLEQALARELYWIHSHREQGFTLVNIVGISSLTQPKTVRRKKAEPRPVVQVPWYLELWDIADLCIGTRSKTDRRPITVEYATDDEFALWLAVNKVDPSYVDTYMADSDWFYRRCLIINDAIDQGYTLEFTNGKTLSSENLLPRRERNVHISIQEED